MLIRKGIIVRSKEVKIIKTKSGLLHKGNCDIELAMDTMLNYDRLDTAVIMSGNSDFQPLIAFLQEKGKKVIAISTRRHVAREIIESSDYYLHFNLFKTEWKKST